MASSSYISPIELGTLDITEVSSLLEEWLTGCKFRPIELDESLDIKSIYCTTTTSDSRHSSYYALLRSLVCTSLEASVGLGLGKLGGTSSLLYPDFFLLFFHQMISCADWFVLCTPSTAFQNSYELKSYCRSRSILGTQNGNWIIFWRYCILDGSESFTRTPL